MDNNDINEEIEIKMKKINLKIFYLFKYLLKNNFKKTNNRVKKLKENKRKNLKN